MPELTFEQFPWRERITHVLAGDIVAARLWLAVQGKEAALPYFTTGCVRPDGKLALHFVASDGEEHSTARGPTLVSLAKHLLKARDEADLSAAEEREFFGLYETWLKLPQGAIELALKTI